MVADVDSTNFDTGTLTVSFTAGSDSAEDVLAIRNQGTGAGQIGVSGSDGHLQGVTIGTFTGGSSGSNLVITLNSSATPTAVTALVREHHLSEHRHRCADHGGAHRAVCADRWGRWHQCELRHDGHGQCGQRCAGVGGYGVEPHSGGRCGGAEWGGGHSRERLHRGHHRCGQWGVQGYCDHGE